MSGGTHPRDSAVAILTLPSYDASFVSEHKSDMVVVLPCILILGSNPQPGGLQQDQSSVCLS